MENLKLSKIQLTNFRNISQEIIDFGPGINCILGENGNGKTNILEAIYYLTQRKSFRKNTSFSQILSMDVDNPEISFSSLFEDNSGKKITFSGKWQQNGSEWFLDGKPARKKISTQSVFINPFDSFSFHNIPSFRRNWVDNHLSLIDTDYKKNLKKYTDCLRFRNSLLNKKPALFLEQIKAIDSDFSVYSEILLKKRLVFLHELKTSVQRTFKEIFSEEHELEVIQESRFLDLSATDILKKLEENLEKDVVIGHTSYGVHKDDYLLIFDGISSFDFCSLGQQKMSYLSLLFAYIELFRYKLGAYPIVLIDDVSGELDRLRWSRLISYLKEKNFQVLITTANENFREELEKIEDAKKILVQAGNVKNLQ